VRSPGTPGRREKKDSVSFIQGCDSGKRNLSKIKLKWKRAAWLPGVNLGWGVVGEGEKINAQLREETRS